MSFEQYTEEQYRSLDADSLSERRKEILSEVDNVDSEISVDVLDEESKRCMAEIDRRAKFAELRKAEFAHVAAGNGNIVERKNENDKEKDMADHVIDRFDTEEYRNAFMNYITRGVQIPMELRTNNPGTVTTGTTMSTDNPPEVPTTLAKEIVQKMSEYGVIWNKVKKIAVQGGIQYRVLDLKPTASWITESTPSSAQKITSDMMISFSFYMLECRMAQSLLTQAVTYSDFQAMFVPAVAEAMVRALEAAIVSGDGSGKFLGIVNDGRITNVVEMTSADFGNWQAWHKKVKAAMPKAYRNGEFIMCQSSFDCYIETMADDNHAPVSVGYNPVTGEEVMRLVGKNVTTVEPDILPDFDSATAGDVVAIFGDMNNYVVNTQPGMPMSTVRWIDHETNTEKIKSLMAADGKVLDPYGFILIKKKASA